MTLRLCIAWIWAVTAYDIWCCEVLEPRYELNPLAAWLLVNCGMFTLLALKVFGTFLATEILRVLPLRYLRVVLPVITVAMTLLLGVLTGVVPIC